MKKLIVLLTGLIFSVICLSGCSDNDVFIQKSYTADKEKITEIRLDVRDRKIVVTPSADNQIRIDYSENSEEYYAISVSDGHVLNMTTVNDKNLTDYIGWKPALDSRTISLQLPDQVLSALFLSTTNETISLPALTVTEDILLSTTGGNLEFDHLHAGNMITLKTKNGDIRGSIIGSYDDYAISCTIKKGESNLPTDKDNGTKALTVFNNNGDVAIEFVKDE